MTRAAKHRRSRALGFVGTLALLPLSCAHDQPAQPASSSTAAQAHSGATLGALRPLEQAEAALTQLASSFEAPKFEAVAEAVLEPAPLPEPPPPPPTAEEIAELLAAAEATLREHDVKVRPRSYARGPLPEGSGLRQAYAEDRAIGLEGRLQQIREWAALAKFGALEPGPQPAVGPLARYDLVVTRDPRKRGDTAYLHIVVPSEGIAVEGARGRHEAWIAGERWINLGDRIAPARDYLVFKTNAEESLHRQWGKAEVIASLAEIAGEYRERTGVPLGIGDVSHVTGGKIEDHWTHQKGVDADLYLLDPSDTDDEGRPRIWWHHFKRGRSLWTSKPKGKGEREGRSDPEDEASLTPTGQRLRVLAQIVFFIDPIAYFVHNDPTVLAAFDAQAGDRRPGRRFLHAKNRGYWPTHADHVHLRWVEGKLPVDATPRP